MDMGKNMIIVGAGIAGISTGCYARMNGYDTTIFEMHDIPGGLCTAWKRKGFTFDISMHMLTGSKSGPIHTMWKELNAVQDQPFHYHDEMVRIENGDKSLSLCTEHQRLQEQMLALSPSDADLIKEFVQLLSRKSMIGKVSLTPLEIMGFIEKLKMVGSMLPFFGIFKKYGKVTLQDFAERFQNPFLRDAVRLFLDSPGWPMPRFPMSAMAGFIESSILEAGVPLGGSQKVVYRMIDHYKNMGGEINYKSRVKDILVENDKAAGIRLENGTAHRADVVVWAGDGHTAIFDILGGRYLDDELRDMYDNWVPVKPLVHVALGINRDMSAEPHRIVIKLDKPVTVGGEEHRWMCFLHHSFDSGMAPAGKSAVEVWYATQYDKWEELAKDPKQYKAEKKRIADFTIAELDKRWPGIADQIEVVDVPTPVTYVRYTGNWQGSPDGWYINPDNMRKQNCAHSLPGLANFHMVGQWTRPFSGTVMAALSGRQLVQILCKRSGSKFKTVA